VPDIPGVAAAPYLTNETVLDNRCRPEHLIVIGGGPSGIEMAQAHRRLGARVTVIAYPTRGEASKSAAQGFYTPALFSHHTRRLVRFLARFG
jgi:NADPH-dependent glutamate synthase beta subunit-like oxidoreductase